MGLQRRSIESISIGDLKICTVQCIRTTSVSRLTKVEEASQARITKILRIC